MKFNFRVLTNNPERLNVVATKLGATKADVVTMKDIGKPFVMGTQGNFALAATGNSIDGFLDSIDAGPTEDGMIFGGVARGGQGSRFEVQLEGAANVLDLVTAGANPTYGTATTTGRGIVKVAVDQAAAGLNLWRIISFAHDGTAGVAGDIAVIERI